MSKMSLNACCTKIFLTGLVLFSLSFISFIILVIIKILTGHGLETYLTRIGVKFTYLGGGVLFVCAALFFLLAFIIRWWHLREEKDFFDKYGNK